MGKNVTFSVGKTHRESAGKVAVYSAGEHPELVCGQARLVLTRGGKKSTGYAGAVKLLPNQSIKIH